MRLYHYRDFWRAQISALIQLAKADNDFDGLEKLHILYLARTHDIGEQEVVEMERNPLPLPDFSELSEEEKFEFLYNLVQIMKIDGEVYNSEIEYCEDIAVQMGFDKEVIKEMSARIYANPSITPDIESLKKDVFKLDKHPNFGRVLV